MKKNTLLILLMFSIVGRIIQPDKEDIKPEDNTSLQTFNGLENGKLNSISESFWDSTNSTVHSSNLKTKHKLNVNYKIFGWHLYSTSPAYKDYNFSLLWSVSYFAYFVNPDNGSYKNIHQWKTTDLIDSCPG